MKPKVENRLGDRILMGLVFLFLYAPIFILIIFSFNAGSSSSVWKGFSLHWYEELIHNRLILSSVYTTLLVSLLATVIATIAGTFAAIGLFSMRRKSRDALMAVNNIPMMNADIVTGVSLCLLFVVFFNGWGVFAGWINSIQNAVTLPTKLSLGFGTMLIAPAGHASAQAPQPMHLSLLITLFSVSDAPVGQTYRHRQSFSHRRRVLTA